MRSLHGEIQEVEREGTRYQVHFIRHVHGGWIWIWMPETRVIACGWTEDRVGAEVRCSIGKLGRSELATIAMLADRVRTPSRAKVGGSSCAFRPPEGSE